MEADNNTMGFPSIVDRWEQITDHTFRDAMEALLREGSLLSAIQFYRAKYSVPLRFAKRGVLFWRAELGLDAVPGEPMIEEVVETFDIRWRATFHPQKQFLFWRRAEAFFELRFDLQIAEQVYEDTFALSWWGLTASVVGDGEYEIFTCGCGDMECGGFTAVEVIYLNDRVLWYDVNSRTPWHVFDETDYRAAIGRMDAAVQELTRSQPNTPVKFYFEFNQK